MGVINGKFEVCKANLWTDIVTEVKPKEIICFVVHRKSPCQVEKSQVCGIVRAVLRLLSSSVHLRWRSITSCVWTIGVITYTGHDLTLVSGTILGVFRIGEIYIIWNPVS
ncbi:hypothetical protein V8G54_000874 [Vigna mungo]|uniref:Uncharacterized protein n=1 Tax=Vigna mungo TaxID=3915 RepID=A0AAQ3P772_VIGMU